MKKILFSVLAIMLITACGDKTEDLKEQVNSLTTEWQTANADARGIAQATGNTLNVLQTASFRLDSLAGAQTGPLSDEMQTKITDLRTRMEAANNNVIVVMQGVGDAARPLANLEAQMAALEKAAELGEGFPENAELQIENIGKAINNAKSKYDGLTQKLEAVRTEVEAINAEVNAMAKVQG